MTGSVGRTPTERNYLSIREVLDALIEEFPDVTISKIRFLESRGLIHPERTPSGYRKFYDGDVERLRWILRQQREHFLPLKVIKGRLDRQNGALVDLPETPSLFDADFDSEDAASALASVLSNIKGAARSPSSGARASSAELEASVVHESVDITVALGETRSLAALSDHGGVPSGVGATGEGARAPTATANGFSVAAGAPAHVVAPGTLAPPDVAVPSNRSPRPTAPASGPDLKGEQSARPSLQAGSSDDTAPRDRAATSTGQRRSDSPSTTAPASRTPAVHSADDTPPLAEDARVRGERSVPTNASASAPSPVEPAPKAAPATPERTAHAVAAPTAASAPRGGGAADSLRDEPTPRHHHSATDDDLTDVQFSLAELAAAASTTPELIAEIEEYGLITSKEIAEVVCFDGDALLITKLAAGFRRYGIEARHLKAIRHSAERDASLFAQVVTPLLRQRNPEARGARRNRELKELSELGTGLHDAFLRAGFRAITGG